MKILLNDILQLETTDNVKIRFNIQNNEGYDPLKFFKENNKAALFHGQFWNTKNQSFQEGEIAIGFLRIENDEWLLFDISRITKASNKPNAAPYKYETITKYKKYFGRLIIKYHNKPQQLKRKANNVIKECEVSQITKTIFK